jgi:branched-chain amino acid transport system permease protein
MSLPMLRRRFPPNVSTRTTTAGVVVATLIVWPLLAPKVTHFYGVLSLCYAMVAVSLTVLSGWTGQISLGHAAFFGIGVYAAQPLLVRGVPLIVTLIAVAAFGAAVSLVLGIPSLRLRGVYLSIVTLAFGAVCERFFFPLTPVSGGTFAKRIPVPNVFGIDLRTERSLYYVVLIAAVIAFAAAHRMRRTDVGRVLLAIRDSENGAQALGVRIAPYKIGAFAYSGAVTTVAGAFYGMLIGATPAAGQFGILLSLFFLAMPVIGGIEFLSGALVGGALLASAQPLFNTLNVRLYLASGLLLTLVFALRTGGVVGLFASVARDVRRLEARSNDEGMTSFLPEDRPTPPRVRVRFHERPPSDSIVKIRFVRARP